MSAAERHGTVESVSCNDAYSFSKPVRDQIVLVAGIGVDGDVHAGVHVRHRHRVRIDPSQPNLRQVHLIRAELFDEVRAEGFAVAPGQLGENVTTRGLDLLELPRGTILRFGRPSGGAGRSGTDQAGPENDGEGAGRENAGERAGPANAGERAGLPDGALLSYDEARAGAPAGPDAVAGVVSAAANARLDAPTAEALTALVAAVDRAGDGDGRPAVVITGMRNPCRQIDAFQDGLLGQVAYRDEDGTFVRKAGIMGVVLHGGPIRPGDPITAELPPEPHLPLDRI